MPRPKCDGPGQLWIWRYGTPNKYKRMGLLACTIKSMGDTTLADVRGRLFNPSRKSKWRVRFLRPPITNIRNDAEYKQWENYCQGFGMAGNRWRPPRDPNFVPPENEATTLLRDVVVWEDGWVVVVQRGKEAEAGSGLLWHPVRALQSSTPPRSRLPPRLPPLWLCVSGTDVVLHVPMDERDELQAQLANSTSRFRDCRVEYKPKRVLGRDAEGAEHGHV